MKQGFVYIIANKRNGTLYTGVTSDLIQRIYQHRNEMIDGFSKKYGAKMLVYYEVYDNIADAILREKQIKKWNRAWKIRIIEGMNPDWQDLYEELHGCPQ